MSNLLSLSYILWQQIYYTHTHTYTLPLLIVETLFWQYQLCRLIMSCCNLFNTWLTCMSLTPLSGNVPCITHAKLLHLKWVPSAIVYVIVAIWEKKTKASHQSIFEVNWIILSMNLLETVLLNQRWLVLCLHWSNRTTISTEASFGLMRCYLQKIIKYCGLSADRLT